MRHQPAMGRTRRRGWRRARFSYKNDHNYPQQHKEAAGGAHASDRSERLIKQDLLSAGGAHNVVHADRRHVASPRVV